MVLAKAGALAASEYNVRGVPVAFPFEPYPSQLVFMDRVVEALQAPQRNALLESPTGTGKTLCLLCAALAWREMQKAHLQAEQLGLTPATAQGAAMLKKLTAGAVGEEKAWLGGREVPASAPAAGPNPASFAPQMACRIIYMSRTHGQLSQVVRELRNTAYRPNISVLGSRAQYCVHHDVKKVPAGQKQNAQCQKLVGTQSCQFHRNVMDHKHQHKEVLTAAMDIEDLVKHGEKHKVCPYYLTRDTAKDADVIFMPYNYLTDPASRKSLSELWKDSIVIFDEAHNMESICSEAASFDLTATDIAMCVTEVDRCTSIKESGIELTTTEPATAEELTILKLILREFEDALASVPLKGSPAAATFSGSYIYELFEAAGVKHDNAPELFGMVSKTVSMLSEAQGAGIQANPSLKKFHDALESVFKSSNMVNSNRLYKVHITEEPERKGKKSAGPSITDMQPTIDRALRPGHKPRQIGYWCFSAGVTMREILDQGVRNVLLASGTLAPMASWPIEMQMPFQVSPLSSRSASPEATSATLCFLEKLGNLANWRAAVRCNAPKLRRATKPKIGARQQGTWARRKWRGLSPGAATRYSGYLCVQIQKPGHRKPRGFGLGFWCPWGFIPNQSYYSFFGEKPNLCWCRFFGKKLCGAAKKISVGARNGLPFRAGPNTEKKIQDRASMHWVLFP